VKRRSPNARRKSDHGIEEEWSAELQRVAAMNVDEARQVLLDRVEQGTRLDMARKIREVEAEAHEEADRRARAIITMALERIASDHVSEFSVSSVDLPSDEMKGRIIGRQGRNIRAIEQALGVDLVVDDTPEAIIISSYDPIRREVARIALSKLVADGRIHPSRIEKEVEKAQQEIDRIVAEAGEQAMIEAGVSGLHREVQKILGRLKFRTSYGQNQLQHAVETAKLAGIIASELHANVRIAKMGGLLHDLGKAVTHEIDGPHAIVGAEIAKRYGVPDVVINAIASHHAEVEPESIEAVIVAAADAISGARPGARRESLETYIKRVTELEEIGNSFKGVSQTYAIQAGREIRVLVRPDDVDDLAAINLSKDIAKKIEDNLQYPGQIRVTVVRETRAVEYAK
jgi:ribonuclease Y